SFSQPDRAAETMPHRGRSDNANEAIAKVAVSSAVRTAAAGPGSLGSLSTPRYTFSQHPAEASAWTVPYGKEFWRRPKADKPRNQPVNKVTQRSFSLPASIDLGDVIERVSYALTSDDATPEVKGATYEASFQTDGLHFRSYRPEESEHLPE